MFKYSTIIGRKLISWLLAFSFFITLAAFAFILNTDYQRGLNSIDRGLEQIRSSYQQSISYSLWNFDYRQIETQLEGILNFPGVVYVYIENKDAVLHSAGNVYNHADQHFSFPLEFTSAGQLYGLGTLHISLDYTGLKDEILEKAINILVSQFFKTFSIALFVMFIVHQLITRRLAMMAEWANQFSLWNLDTPLKTGQKEGQQDELSMVADAVNNMRKRLQHDVMEQERNRHEIENIKEQLSIAINNAAIGFCTYTAETDEWQGNAHFAAQLGIAENALEQIPHPMEALLNRITGSDAAQQKERINQLLLGRLSKIEDTYVITNFHNEVRHLAITLQTTRFQETRPAQILICVIDRTQEEIAISKARELAVSLENKVTQRTEELYNEQLRAKATIRILEQELARLRQRESSDQQQVINRLLLQELAGTESKPVMNALRDYLQISTEDNAQSLNLAQCVKQWISDEWSERNGLNMHLPFSLIIEENPHMIRFLFHYLILQEPAAFLAEKTDIHLRLVKDKLELCAHFHLPATASVSTDKTRDDITSLCLHILNSRYSGKFSREHQGHTLTTCFTMAMSHL